MRNKKRRLRRLGATAVVVGTAANAIGMIRRWGARRRRVDLRMTVVVERPLPEVFEFCRDFENLPRVVQLPLEVHDSLDGRSHWRVPSNVGVPTEWDASITKYVPNSVIAWESEAQSTVKASGTMRFSPLSPSDTRVDVELKYLPRDTNLGQAIRAIVNGGNSKRVRGAVAAASRQLSRQRD